MAKKKSKKAAKKVIKISPIEKMLYLLAVLALVLSPIFIVFSKATLSKINYEVEQQKKLINEQKKTNEGLNMVINELASLQKIQEVAEEQGLSYNNGNIKTITESEIVKEDTE